MPQIHAYNQVFDQLDARRLNNAVYVLQRFPPPLAYNPQLFRTPTTNQPQQEITKKSVTGELGAMQIFGLATVVQDENPPPAATMAVLYIYITVNQSGCLVRHQ